VKHDRALEKLLEVYESHSNLRDLFPNARSKESDLIGLAETAAGLLEFAGEEHLRADPQLAALKPYLETYKRMIGFPPCPVALDMKCTLVRHQLSTAIHDHLPTLFMVTKEFHLARVLELGVEYGNSTIALLEAVAKIGGHVWSIDQNPCLEARALVRECELERYWTFIQGDDLKVPWCDPIDHLFIDTFHVAKQTFAELQRFEPLVADGGFISLHDSYSFPGVSRGVREYFSGRNDVVFYEYRNDHGFLLIRKRKNSHGFRQITSQK
jgi:predicted O-methyltransferase YrrM